MDLMPRIVLLLIGLALAGCSSPNGANPQPTSPEAISVGQCDIQLPDGSKADCKQHAQESRQAPSRAGYICTEQTVGGPQGTVSILRRPASDETVLSLELTGKTNGIVWLQSDPVRMWAWASANGDEAWALGRIEAGQTIIVKAYTFTIRDANATSEPATIEQRWTTVNGQAYAIQRIVVAGSELFLDRMVGIDRGSGVEYSLASFDHAVGARLLEGRHTPVISTRLVTDDLPSC